MRAKMLLVRTTSPLPSLSAGGISRQLSTTRALTGSTVGMRCDLIDGCHCSVSHFSSKYQKIRALANGLYIRLLYI